MGNSPTRLDYAYFAGMLDGEGTLYIRQLKVNYARFELTFCSAHPEVIQWAQARWPARVRERPGKKVGHRSSWEWRLLTPSALQSLLPHLLPYLILKRRHVEIVLAYYETVRGEIRLPTDSIKLRHKLLNELRARNKKGRW